MSIYVIRHGETDNNANGVVQMPDSPLSQRGEAQAELLAERIADAGITLVLASDYSRARRTAEHVSQRCGVELRELESLRERHFGEIRGRPYSEVGELILKPDYDPPGGESWAAFHERVKIAWDQVLQVVTGMPGHIAVITHGLVCYSLASRVFALPDPGEVPIGFGNTALTIVDAEPPWSIELLACTAHLDAASGPRGTAV